MENSYNNLKIAERGARVSIIAYITLSLLKLGVGFFAQSKALLADGINNTTDIIASVAVLIGLKISGKPADDDHPYGHLRAETIASLIASLIMLAVGLDVLYNAIKSVIFFNPKAPDLVSAVVAIFCAAAIYMVYRYNMRIAVKIKSSGLMAAAKDNLSDAWVSIGTTIGIVASQFGFPWIDPLAAVVVSALILKTGWDIFREATHNLSDGFSREKLDGITKSINQVPGVKQIKNIRARVHGNNILLDLVVSVSSELSLVEGHSITEKIEDKLKEDLDITQVMVHVEPDK
ncbi:MULTISPECIES: cation diffusion facilitator family transporter [Clostridium]|jgi:cation diffusion facilitator family transporter|uniref:Cation transporter n=3 Tax=Bacteria TaxID=2 RepID=A0AAE2UYF2_CLOBE|nr:MULTISPECIES: cation diffusion facilitator family transporter [Clostridium]ABR33646.1 cation diffusion facilitator family transporter [Clostridium beijerinckii NCIMB 8052]AIU04167.1 cation diffusion facilitator family transporter [Clostridium beijerinckii ATCC 35702]MBF7812064.1 cation transporter [Clostridium beijerinckii]NRT25081.1 cation diffusion facilitator family transporter [Clostridium beijerinckii]NRT67325.1 cation diffusion facilitator family transporter [Clostridium beijerinckii]